MNFSGNFADFILFFFWSFIFITYLMALLSIIGDLMRDRTLNGWWKALWIICLAFIPFLTALAYVIIRGKAMAERSQRNAVAAREASESYIRQVAAVSPTDEINRAQALLQEGAISHEEFGKLKSLALARSGA